MTIPQEDEERWTIHQCQGCGKVCGDRDGWEAHVARAEAGEFEHPSDYRWQLVEVAPLERTRRAETLAAEYRETNNRLRKADAPIVEAERERAETAEQQLAELRQSIERVVGELEERAASPSHPNHAIWRQAADFLRNLTQEDGS